MPAKLQQWLFPILFVVVLVAPFVVRLAVGGDDGERAEAGGDVRKLVIVTPHNRDIQIAFEEAFDAHHRREHGGGVDLIFVQPGGTGEVVRLIESTYESLKIDGKLPPPEQVDGQTQYDMVWGGGDYEFNVNLESKIGALQPLDLPADLIDAAYPSRDLAGIALLDSDDDGAHWFGVCLSSFGIVYSPFVYEQISTATGEPMPPPRTWGDLTKTELAGRLALADPGSSGSAAVAYMMVLQRAMADAEEAFLKENAKDNPGYDAAVNAGWTHGMGELLQIAANARYFSDSAQKVPSDVSSANCAAGMAIDFYGRVEQEQAGPGRIAYVSPPAATAITPDPIAVLHGTTGERLETATRFVEFLLSPEGQAVWIKRAGTPGGPRLRSLRRLPVRPDVYGDKADWTDAADPFAEAGGFNQRGAWMVEFGETRTIWQAAWIDAEESLRDAYAAALSVQDPARRDALMEQLRSMPSWRGGVLDYPAVKALRTERKAQPDATLPEWTARTRIALADAFRAHYAAVERAAE